MHRIASAAVLACALICAAGCAPTLTFNRSYLVSEEVKVAQDGYGSIKSTGETFNLGPIRALEKPVDHVQLIETHGSWLLVGDGYQKLWRLWPAGGDSAHYEAVELVSGRRGFAGPQLSQSGNCALIKWTRDGAPAQAFVTSGGSANETRCSDE